MIRIPTAKIDFIETDGTNENFHVYMKENYSKNMRLVHKDTPIVFPTTKVISFKGDFVEIS